MNVLESLEQELKRNSHWSLEEKKRYLYIQSCLLFTFDTRHYFVSDYEWAPMIKNASMILEEIQNNEIDLENMTDNRVYCYSWANAYQKMLKELLNVESKVVENMFGDHAWCIFGHKADATVDSDLTRVKMNFCSIGYELSTCEDEFIYDVQTPQKLKKMDKNIRYIEKNYFDLNPIVNFLKIEFQNLSLSLQESLFWWLNQIKETFYFLRSNLKNFEDASFCISYLFEYFFPKNLMANYKRITLFDDSDFNWSFLDIYRIDFLKNTFYYILIHGEDGYHFNELSYLDVMHYVSSFNGPEKEELLQRHL